MTYAGYTDAKKASNKRHMDKLARLVVWCTPEEKSRIAEQAAAAGMSMNAWCKRKIFCESVVESVVKEDFAAKNKDSQ